MILVAYRHGLRASELTDTRWDQIDIRTATLHVRRVKQGTPSTLGDELRALRRLQREQETKSPFVFTSERGSPFTTAGFARIIERAGRWPSWPSRPTRICSGMPAVMRSLTEGTTQEPCRLTSAIRTSSTPSDTLSCRRRGSRISGGSERRRRRQAPCRRR
jgi:hypothetical protein